MQQTKGSSIYLGDQEAEIGEDQGGESALVKKTTDSTLGAKVTADPKTAKTATEAATKEEEETLSDKAGEKIQDKVVDSVKEKVQDKAKEILGDPKAGKEELGDIVIDSINKTNAERANRLGVGKKASQVSTTVASNANVSPLVVSGSNAAVAANVAPTAAPASQAAAAASHATSTSRKVASAAGKGTPPPSAIPSASTVSKGAGVLEDLMAYGKDLSSAVFKGAKESKNIRMLGLATLAGATGWAVGKRKDAQKAQTQEFNRQQAIRRSLMSDG